jgi:RNA polymerase sigma-70 factor, ECF subfamily
MSDDAEPKRLLERAQKGDTEAFGRLYELYYKPVYRYIYLRVGSRELSEDLTQTVFMKVHRSIDRFQVRKVSPLAYFFTVARNSIIDHWKRKKEATFADLEIEAEQFAQADTAAETLDVRHAHGVAMAALSRLKEGEREALTLKFVSQLSNREIAKVMRKSEDAVRQLQSRGLRSLRGELSI